MKYLIGIIGIIVFLGLAWLASNGKKRIRIRPIAVMLVLQLILGYILLNTGIGNFLVGGFA
ncbi:Na+ dependent nucleoside transporter N-terminal domain-containing protein, partial [Bacillus velezensis]